MHELIVCCTGGKGKQIKQSASKSGGEIGMKRRQKMRSECRVLLVYCVITRLYVLYMYRIQRLSKNAELKRERRRDRDEKETEDEK